MTTAERGTSLGFTTLPRAVLSVAAGVVYSVERAMVGDARVRTARSNAWEAICADRDRARRNAEVRRLVAALATEPSPETRLTAQVAVGSSPRSSASQASLVSAGSA